MNIVKILFAVSLEEFEKEKKELGNYIRSLNDIYVKNGIYFELTVCNELSEMILEGENRKENSVEETQYFYILLGKKVEPEILNRFNKALYRFRETNEPYIYTYFYEMSKGEKEDADVLDFMKRLDREIGHYYSTFSHLDVVKLNMLVEWMRNPKTYSKVKFEDGKVVLNGMEILSLENIPVYSRNEELQRFIEIQKQLNEEFVRLRLENISNPLDEEIFQNLLEVSEKRKQVSEQIHQLEMAILNLCTNISEIHHSGRVLSWREKWASELVDKGDYNGALEILEDEERDRELFQAEKIIDHIVEERIKSNMAENNMRISILKANGITKATLMKIRECYENNVRLAEKYHIELKNLYSYATFLYEQKNYRSGYNLVKRLQWYYEQENGEIPREDMAMLKNILAKFAKENREPFKKVSKNYDEALKIYQSLVEEGKERYKEDIALIYNDLGILAKEIGNYEEAEKYYIKALEIFDNMIKKNYYVSLVDLIIIYDNLGNLSLQKGEIKYAEWYSRRALELSCELEKKEPGLFEEYIAKSNQQYGAVLIERIRRDFLLEDQQLKELEMCIKKSFDIYMKLAQENPEKYEKDMSISCSNISVLGGVGVISTKEAVEYQKKALEMMLRLVEKNGAVYEKELGVLYHNLGIGLRDNGNYNEAVHYFEEAINIRQKLARTNFQLYGKNLADTNKSLGTVFGLLGDEKKANKYFQESLNIYQRLSKKSPGRYDMEMARIIMAMEWMDNSSFRNCIEIIDKLAKEIFLK